MNLRKIDKNDEYIHFVTYVSSDVIILQRKKIP